MGQANGRPGVESSLSNRIDQLVHRFLGDKNNRYLGGSILVTMNDNAAIFSKLVSCMPPSDQPLKDLWETIPESIQSNSMSVKHIECGNFIVLHGTGLPQSAESYGIVQPDQPLPYSYFLQRNLLSVRERKDPVKEEMPGAALLDRQPKVAERAAPVNQLRDATATDRLPKEVPAFGAVRSVWAEILNEETRRLKEELEAARRGGMRDPVQPRREIVTYVLNEESRRAGKDGPIAWICENQSDSVRPTAFESLSSFYENSASHSDGSAEIASSSGGAKPSALEHVNENPERDSNAAVDWHASVPPLVPPIAPLWGEMQRCLAKHPAPGQWIHTVDYGNFVLVSGVASKHQQDKANPEEDSEVNDHEPRQIALLDRTRVIMTLQDPLQP